MNWDWKATTKNGYEDYLLDIKMSNGDVVVTVSIGEFEDGGRRYPEKSDGNTIYYLSVNGETIYNSPEEPYFSLFKFAELRAARELREISHQIILKLST